MRKTFLIRVKSFLASVPRKISCRFFLPVCNPAKMRKRHKGGTYKETSLYLEILFYLWRIEICIGMLLAILHILVRKPALSISHTYLKHVLEIHVYVFSVFPKDKSHNKSFLFGGAWSRDLCSFKCSCVLLIWRNLWILFTWRMDLLCVLKHSSCRHTGSGRGLSCLILAV